MSGKSRLLYELMLRKGYPEEFSRLICAEMSTDFTAEKMMSYVSGPKKRLEDVADEMVAIQDHNCVIISESGYNTGYKRGRRFSSLEFQRLYASDFFESHVLRQMHRGMLYEPLSSIAAPFFVAITGIQAYRTIPPMLTKTQKYEKKHQRYGI